MSKIPSPVDSLHGGRDDPALPGGSQDGYREINSGARHTFSTYSYAYTQNSGLCKKWTGHRGGDSLFLTRYAGLEKKVRGELYFQILPPAEIPMVRVTTKFGKRAHWPSDEELLTWAERSTKVAIAKWLGVSDVAVHKRLKKIRDGLSSGG